MAYCTSLCSWLPCCNVLEQRVRPPVATRRTRNGKIDLAAVRFAAPVSAPGRVRCPVGTGRVGAAYCAVA